MNIELRLARRKQQTTILVDGHEVKHILDFDVDVRGDLPCVILKIWPETLIITGPNVAVVKKKLLRVGPRWRWLVDDMFRQVRRAGLDLCRMWRESRFLASPEELELIQERSKNIRYRAALQRLQLQHPTEIVQIPMGDSGMNRQVLAGEYIREVLER